MQPLLFPGDYISVSNTAYLDQSPQRNDVVVFYKPTSDKSKPKISYIKRVVAIAGEKVALQKGQLFINDIAIKENYVDFESNRTPYSQEMKPIIVPNNHMFLLGDNRDNSRDSRSFGSVAESEIFAKASGILFGINNRSGNTIK